MSACAWSMQSGRIGADVLSFEGGLDRAPWLDPPPLKAQLTEPPKTNLGIVVVQMAVVFVLKETWSPVNSGCTCV